MLVYWMSFIKIHNQLIAFASFVYFLQTLFKAH